jgi:hypothetical protein
MKVKLTPLGFHWALLAQYDALLLSSSAYDAGHRGEIARIANAIYILVGRGKRSHTSIIDGMGAADILLSSTVRPDGRGRSTALIQVEALPLHAPELGVSCWQVYMVPRKKWVQSRFPSGACTRNDTSCVTTNNLKCH